MAAGTINAIAGGGSLLTLPLLIFIGLDPTVANGTNRIAVLLGAIGGTTSFARRGLIPTGWLRMSLPPALIGVGLGTWAAVRVGDAVFEGILTVVLLLAAVWMIWHPVQPPAEGYPELPVGRRRWLVIGAFIAIGLYGGFIQAGIGFLFLALLAAQGFDLVRANALKLPMILGFTVLAVTLFAANGKVVWSAGLTMAAGQFVGAKLGVHLQVLKGQEWVRRVLTVMVVLFAVRLALG